MIEKLSKIIRELGHLTPMAIVMLFLPMVGSITLIALMIPFGEWLRINWELGALLFLIGMIGICGLSLIPTNAVSLVGGYAFGFWVGTGILMAGIVGASIVSFLFGSRISGTRLPEVLSKNIRVDAVYKSLLHENFFRTASIVALLRGAFMPFAFTNFLLASARISMVPFVTGTFIGMLPRTAAAAFVGAGLAQLDIENTRDLVSLALGVAATLVAIIAIARLSRKALLRIANEENLVEDGRKGSFILRKSSYSAVKEKPNHRKR